MVVSPLDSRLDSAEAGNFKEKVHAWIDAVVGLFQLTRMVRVFRLFSSIEEARAAIG